MQDILNLTALKLPLIEQDIIIKYLSEKTSQIDTLIEKKQKMIELLKEERTAIINHAVTKGLNPDVNMKDSGIQWIGRMPEHWQTLKLKYSDLVIMGQSPSSEDYNTSYAGLSFLQGNADFTDLHPLPRIYCESANKIAETNDILLSVRAPIGEVNIADQKYGIGRGLCAIRAVQTSQKYLYYEMLCLNDELNSIGTGSTYTAISVDDIKNIIATCPPLVEQNIIAKFLDIKTQQIDTLIAKEENLISSLQEYRTALISEIVTGKLDLRDKVTV
jgi:type I restriction enzyme S subunit